MNQQPSGNGTQPHINTQNIEVQLTNPTIKKSQPLPKTQLQVLKQQNYKLRFLNKNLRKDLLEFQSRLDQQIHRKERSQQKHKGSLIYSATAQNMELKNAYKQIDIHKKQIEQLKIKSQFYEDGKIDHLGNEINTLKKQKQQLLQQIKGLKKINKYQSKGLTSIKDISYSKVMEENQKLKEQNKKLISKNVKEELTVQLNKITNLNEKRKEKLHHQKKEEEEKSKMEREEHEKQILKGKISRCQKQLKRVEYENKSFRDIIDNLKLEIQTKDKEINTLRSRLVSYRHQTNSKRLTTEPIAQRSKTSFIQHADKSVIAENQKQIRQFSEELESKKMQANYLSVKVYPKIVEKGIKVANSCKWNHQEFNSKVKEIQVCPHAQGHVNNINFRYQKGQPSKPGPGQYSSFCCADGTEEHIKSIEGGFKDNLLQYLVIRTSQGRVSKFCKFELESECEKFVFGDKELEHVGAFFGETTDEGVVKVGCYVDVLKKQ